jgi:hypothetical protein
MTDGKKIALGVTSLFVLAVGVQIAYLEHRNHQAEAPPKDPYADVKLDDDDAVAYNLHKERPDSLKDERTMIGRTLWMSAGGQMDYYRATGHHVDYAHPIGTIAGATPMLIKDVFEQMPPRTGPAVFRIPAGQRHVLLAFTLPQSPDPKTLYALPVGHVEDGRYDLLNDELFFYTDPHTLYKHWGPDTWAHIDKHEVVLGMNETQAMMALGEVLKPSNFTKGERTIEFDNNGHPVTVEFVKNKAVHVTPEK